MWRERGTELFPKLLKIDQDRDLISRSRSNNIRSQLSVTSKWLILSISLTCCLCSVILGSVLNSMHLLHLSFCWKKNHHIAAHWAIIWSPKDLSCILRLKTIYILMFSFQQNLIQRFCYRIEKWVASLGWGKMKLIPFSSRLHLSRTWKRLSRSSMPSSTSIRQQEGGGGGGSYA